MFSSKWLQLYNFRCGPISSTGNIKQASAGFKKKKMIPTLPLGGPELCYNLRATFPQHFTHGQSAAFSDGWTTPLGIATPCNGRIPTDKLAVAKTPQKHLPWTHTICQYLHATAWMVGYMWTAAVPAIDFYTVHIWQPLILASSCPWQQGNCLVNVA